MHREASHAISGRSVAVIECLTARAGEAVGFIGSCDATRGDASTVTGANTLVIGRELL